MPIYEFVCKKCSHEFEEIRKISDPMPFECPECKVVGTIQKKVTAAAFHLKGGGWYNDAYSSKKSTDSKGPEAKKETSEPAAAKSEASSSSESGVKSEPAASKETKTAAPEKKSSETSS